MVRLNTDLVSVQPVEPQLLAIPLLQFLQLDVRHFLARFSCPRDRWEDSLVFIGVVTATISKEDIFINRSTLNI